MTSFNEMILLFLLFNVYHYLYAFSPHKEFSSAILRDNKLYVFNNNFYQDSKPRITQFTLNNTSLPSIMNNTNDQLIDKFPANYQPFLLDINPSNPKEILMMGGQAYTSLKNYNSTKAQLLSSYNLESGNIKYRDTDILTPPSFDQFPQYSYSSTVVQVTQPDGSKNTILYVFGGFIYSKKLKNAVLTNFFYSYNFNTHQWQNLKNTVDQGRIPPLGGHTSVLTNDRYIYMLGGFTLNEGDYTDQVANSADAPNIATLEKFWIFDTQTNTWKTQSATSLALSNSLTDRKFGFSANFYKDYIVVFGGFTGDADSKKPAAFSDMYGRLNLNTNQWNFTNIAFNSDEKPREQVIGYHASVVFKGQLLLIDGTRYDKSDFMKRMYAIDLESDRMTNMLSLEAPKTEGDKPSDSNTLQSSNFPVYGIVLIVVGIVALALVILLTYYRRRKNKQSSSKPTAPNQQNNIQEIWSDQNDPRATKSGLNIYGLESRTKPEVPHNLTGSTETSHSNTKFIGELPHFQHEQDVNFSLEDKASRETDRGTR